MIPDAEQTLITFADHYVFYQHKCALFEIIDLRLTSRTLSRAINVNWVQRLYLETMSKKTINFCKSCLTTGRFVLRHHLCYKCRHKHVKEISRHVVRHILRIPETHIYKLPYRVADHCGTRLSLLENVWQLICSMENKASNKCTSTLKHKPKWKWFLAQGWDAFISFTLPHIHRSKRIKCSEA